MTPISGQAAFAAQDEQQGTANYQHNASNLAPCEPLIGQGKVGQQHGERGTCRVDNGSQAAGKVEERGGKANHRCGGAYG